MTSQIYTKHFGKPKEVKTTFYSKGYEFKCRNRDVVTELVVLAFPKKHTPRQRCQKRCHRNK